MKLQFLGTASAQGWPVTGCFCASCRSAAGNPRRPTSVLIDEAIHIGPASAITAPQGSSGWSWVEIGDQNARPVRLLTSPDGRRVLLLGADCTLPGAAKLRLSVDAEGAQHGVDVVLIAQVATDGDALSAVAAQLARLRSAGFADEQTTIVAIDLDHANPPEPELAALFWAWGIRLPSDGQVLTVAGEPTTRACARRTVVIGGTRSGKSRWAERQLSADPTVTYLATAQMSEDRDWSERIGAHRRRRAEHWGTVETLDVAAVLINPPPGCLLIDDLGNWVSRTLDATDGWNGNRARFGSEAADLLRAWQEFNGHAVLVSNDVGGGLHAPTRAGRLFTDELGQLASGLCAAADEVVTVTAGLAQWLRRPPGMIGA